MASRGFEPPRFNIQNVSHKLAVAILVASVLCAMLGETGLQFLILIPALVFDRFYVWQPFTTLFIATNPIEVIFSCLILYMFGTQLVYGLGQKKFLQVALGIPAAAMLVTLCLTFIFPQLALTPFPGATCVITVVWIAYGLIGWFSGQMMNFWGIPMTGLNFAYMGVGFVLLNGVFQSWVHVIPELLAAGGTFLYFRDKKSEGIMQRVELWYYNWKLKRLKAKRGLHVIEGEGKRNPNTDRQLH